MQARGLEPGAPPDTWNLTHPERVEAVARAYVEAGSQVILTNTFRANAIAMEGDLEAINRAGVAISKRAAAGRALVFASIGPTGKMLMAGEIGGEQVQRGLCRAGRGAGGGRRGRPAGGDHERYRGGAPGGGRRQETGLPVIVSFAFDSGKNKDRTMMGATPEAVAAAMRGSGSRRGRRQLRRWRGVCRSPLPALARRLRSAHLDQAERRFAQAGTDAGRKRGELCYFGGIFRVALRRPARRRRFVYRRLLRVHAGFHSGISEGEKLSVISYQFSVNSNSGRPGATDN